MTSFEDYLLNQKLKNLRPGDRVKYIGKRNYAVEPYEIYTFIGLVGVSGKLYPRIKAGSYTIITHPRDILKA